MSSAGQTSLEHAPLCVARPVGTTTAQRSIDVRSSQGHAQTGGQRFEDRPVAEGRVGDEHHPVVGPFRDRVVDGEPHASHGVDGDRVTSELGGVASGHRSETGRHFGNGSDHHHDSMSPEQGFPGGIRVTEPGILHHERHRRHAFQKPTVGGCDVRERRERAEPPERTGKPDCSAECGRRFEQLVVAPVDDHVLEETTWIRLRSSDQIVPDPKSCVDQHLGHHRRSAARSPAHDHSVDRRS